MARGTTAAAADYFLTTTTPITAPPFCVSIWAKWVSPYTGAYLWGVADSGTADNYFAILINTSSGDMNFTARDTSTVHATIAGGMDQDVWIHIFIEAAQIDERTIWKNDTTSAFHGGVKTPDDLDRLSIGTVGRATPAGSGDFQLAECGAWNRVLADGERAALAARYAPSFFRTGLVQYNPMFRGVNGSTGDENDRVLGTLYNETNTPTVEDHPPMIYPTSALQLGVPVSVPTGRIMSSLAWKGGLAGVGGIAGPGGGLAG